MGRDLEEASIHTLGTNLSTDRGGTIHSPSQRGRNQRRRSLSKHSFAPTAGISLADDPVDVQGKGEDGK